MPPMSGGIVRPAKIDDEAQLFALARSFPTPTPPAPDSFRAALSAKLSDDDSALLVFERNGQLVGYVSGYRHVTFYAGGFTAWVDEVMVAAEHRHTGIGMRLMNGFEQWAGKHECVLVGLATGSAAAFYERLGYISKAGYFKKYLRL
jgi:GNAT superfamily N-acetyltransferase